MTQKIFAVVVMVVCLAAGGVFGYPYIEWEPGMSSSQSSDLGGYPAQNAFDSTVTGWRGDWTYAEGTAQGDAGFQLRTDGHGMWHSGLSGSYTSPAGVAVQEWLMADFGLPRTIYGADIWNIDTFYWARGIKDISISVSTDNVNWSTVWSGVVVPADGTLPDLLYDGVTWVNPNLDPGHDPQYGRLYDQRILFDSGVEAKYVVINIFSQHDAAAYGDYIAVDEIRFLAVPEPATMALLGIGGLLFTRKRRV